MRITETKKYINISDLTIEIQEYNNITDLGISSLMYVDYNFQACMSTNNIIGKVNSIYRRDKKIKANIVLYKRNLLFISSNAYRKLIPALTVMRYKDNQLKIVGLSLASNNIDENVKSIRVQYKEYMERKYPSVLLHNHGR